MTDVDPASLTPGESEAVSEDGPDPPHGPPRMRHKAGMAALTFGALGVVFGDIGTSPLYTLHLFVRSRSAPPATRSRPRPTCSGLSR